MLAVVLRLAGPWNFPAQGPAAFFKKDFPTREKPKQSADGIRARLPVRWPKWETGKTILFSLPSRPADKRTAREQVETLDEVPLRIQVNFLELTAAEIVSNLSVADGTVQEIKICNAIFCPLPRSPDHC